MRAVDALDDPDELAGRLLEASLGLLDARRGVVGLVEGRGHTTTIRRIVRGPADGLASSPAVVAAVVGRGRRVVIGDSAPAVPLWAGGVPVGFLCVDAPALELVTGLARLLSAALQRAREHRCLTDLVEVAGAAVKS